MPSSGRRPGRRRPATTVEVKKHEKLISEAISKRDAKKVELEKAEQALAKRIDAAHRTGFPTSRTSELMGHISRQAVFKFVTQRLNGAPAKKSSSAKKNNRSNPLKK